MSDTTETCSSGGFEGCEKKLEIDFRPTADLRVITRETLNAILDLAKCTIISVTKNSSFDSYVLSESSLFVFPHKVMIKTCGTTSLLHCLPLLLKSAEKAGTEPVFVQFSRCGFMYPSAQPLPHRSFRLEVQYLNTLFDGGQAFVLGPINGARWHLYLADLRKPGEPPVGPDQTLELVMVDLDREAMRMFYHGDHQPVPEDGFKYPLSGKESTQRSGIAALLPGSVIDDFLFQPCGYSCNGLLDNRVYFTIHVTPEPQCSFVSFETNVVMSDYSPLVQAVLSVFRPGRFTMQLFADHASPADQFNSSLRGWECAGFSRSSLTSHHFPGPYTVVCAHYDRLRAPEPGLAPIEVSAADDSADTQARRNSSEAEGARVLEKLSGLSVSAVPLPPASPMLLSSDPGLIPSFVDQVHGAESLLGMGHHEEEQLVEKFHVPYSLASKLSASHLQQLVVAAVRQRAAVKEVPSASGARPGGLIMETVAAEDPEDAFAIVDLARAVERFAKWAGRFPRLRPFYSVKCNADHGLLAALHAMGCGFACTTVPEMEAVLAIGASPNQILFNQPWKSASQVRFLRERQVAFSTYDSVAELTKVFDLNPDGELLLCVAYTPAGASNPSSRRHGCDPADARSLLEKAHELGADVVGITMSVGGATLSLEDMRALLATAREVLDQASQVFGRQMAVLDVGAGFADGLVMDGSSKPGDGQVPFDEAAAVINADVDKLFSPRLHLLARPSGFLVATSQTLAVSVVSKTVSPSGGPCTYHVNDGVYGSFGRLKLEPQVLVPFAAAADVDCNGAALPTEPAVVLGSSGQPSDCLVQLAQLPSLKVGDWIYFRDAGLFTTSSAAPFSVGKSHAHRVRYVASNFYS